ncbi:hypothetical protein [Paenibacillus zanthoxyli]|uniref:hypothetical protein n=1 Tax=Paenibacillus zanthoxyli TaxID=369399 RepID=UPI00046F1BAC|nr:hypothetical protein [Paenibacillus zanthoxyli]
MALLEYYRTELKRMAWRIHYHVKKEQNGELLSNFEPIWTYPGFSQDTDNRIIVGQLLNSLSSEIGKEIIYQLYILGKKEKDVAFELQMTQQAVNRWKNKMLKEMKQKIEKSNS